MTQHIAQRLRPDKFSSLLLGEHQPSHRITIRGAACSALERPEDLRVAAHQTGHRSQSLAGDAVKLVVALARHDARLACVRSAWPRCRLHAHDANERGSKNVCTQMPRAIGAILKDACRHGASKTQQMAMQA